MSISPEADFKTLFTQLKIKTALEITKEPLPQYIIEGILAQKRITVLASEANAGKTFTLLDAACAVAENYTWHARCITTGGVAYVSFEGDDFKSRFDALKEQKQSKLNDIYLPETNYLLSPTMQYNKEFSSSGESELIAQLGAITKYRIAHNKAPITLLILDTLRNSLAGSEDSSENISAYFRACKRILASIPYAGLIISHHAGWQNPQSPTPRERGSSAIRGNADIVLYLKATKYEYHTGLTIQTLKSRDTAKYPDLLLNRINVDVLGLDHFGRQRTSCIIQTSDPNQTKTEERELDLKLLTLIIKQANKKVALTSKAGVATEIGIRNADAGASLNRLFDAKWITQEKQGKPYIATVLGIAEFEKVSKKIAPKPPLLTIVPDRSGPFPGTVAIDGSTIVPVSSPEGGTERIGDHRGPGGAN